MNRKAKSKFDGNFIELGSINIDNIKKVVEEHKDTFCHPSWRGPTHKDVKVILLAYENSEIIPTIYPPNEIVEHNIDIKKKIQFELDELKQLGKKYHNYDHFVIARALLTKLLPNGEIPPHRDRVAFILEKGHRIHIPIITNDNVSFSVGDETKNLKEGHVYEINNGRTHSVKNESNEERVHLIIDLLDENLMNIDDGDGDY